MIHDPTDERYRKPRRLRNTELQKFIRNASLVTTTCFAILIYIDYRKNVVPYVINDKRNRANLDYDPKDPDAVKDYGYIFCKNAYDKIKKYWNKEAANNNTQTDK